MSETVSPSLREAIEAAYDQIEADNAPPEVPPVEEAAPAAALDAEAPAADAPEAEADDFDEAVGVDRETWKLTPAQARERAKALAKEAREAAERVKGYEPIEGVLSKRRDALRATFGDEARALEQLFHLSDWAGRDFTGFVQHLARERGVDLRQLVPAPQQPVDPAQMTYEQIVSQAREEARREAERVAQERDMQRALSDFDGNTSHEFRHDPEIRRVMSGLLQSGAAADLSTAYTMATRAHPVISAKIAERESAAAAKRAADEAAERARKRAEATASVRGAPGTAAPAKTQDPATVRAATLAAWESLAGRD